MKFLRQMADAGFSHWLIRIPLMVVFFQQGMDKMPVTVEGAESWDLPPTSHIHAFFVIPMLLSTINCHPSPPQPQHAIQRPLFESPPLA